MSTSEMTLDDLRDLLVTAIAAQAGIAPADVRPDQPFSRYGLDSMAAMAVGVDIEDHCGLTDLPVNLLWDYPTVDALAPALWEMLGQSTATVSEER